MDLNKIIFLMMLCVPMFVGAQTLTFTDHEPMGNMRTQVTRQFFRLVEQESKGRIRIDHHWNGELSPSYDAYETVREGTKADMATVIPEYDSQRMPLHQLFKSYLAGPSGEEPTAPLTQGYGALEFASDRDQRLHPSFVLVPQYTDWTVQDDWSTTDEVEMTIRLLADVCRQYNVDTNRLYTTGQSMGGMMSFYFNITHPDLFAASLFVSSQWDTSKMQDFGRKRFFYIVAGGDQKAYGGMQDLAKVLKENEARVDSASWSAKLPAEEQERLAEQLIACGSDINFIRWEAGSVLPASGKGMEHMASFDYGNKLAVRDWLFRQCK